MTFPAVPGKTMRLLEELLWKSKKISTASHEQGIVSVHTFGILLELIYLYIFLRSVQCSCLMVNVCPVQFDYIDLSL